MQSPRVPFVPPFCPRPTCVHHHDATAWRFRPIGFYTRLAIPRRIPRFRCLACRISFSSQTFSTTYWLKRPDLQPQVLLRLVECGAHRQIARGLGVVHSTVQRQAERLGRHCLLFHEQRRPRQLPDEPVVLDGFRTFEFSQYWPCDINLLLGGHSRFIHGFTDSELRRSGSMTARQKARRDVLEAAHGRPDPKATEKQVEALLRFVVPEGSRVVLCTDEHAAYPRAIRALEGRVSHHATTKSTAPRTPGNPLFAVNQADLALRHAGANHKRETIAFSKRRQAMAERMAVFVTWRNYMRPQAERRPGGPTPAMLLGVEPKRLAVADVLARRIFPSKVQLPEPLADYYWRRVPTRQLPRLRRHELKRAV